MRSIQVFFCMVIFTGCGPPKDKKDIVEEEATQSIPIIPIEKPFIPSPHDFFPNLPFPKPVDPRLSDSSKIGSVEVETRETVLAQKRESIFNRLFGNRTQRSHSMRNLDDLPKPSRNMRSEIIEETYPNTDKYFLLTTETEKSGQ